MRLKQLNSLTPNRSIVLLGLFVIFSFVECMYEDQVGKIDWYVPHSKAL